MDSTVTISRPLKLDRLPPETQEALYTYCEANSLLRGRACLKSEFGFSIGKGALCHWLRKRRCGDVLLGRQKKTRPDSVLGVLDEEKRKRIFANCDRIPVPDGVKWIATELGIVVSTDSLGEWLAKQRERYFREAKMEKIRDTSDFATLMGKAVGKATEINEANIIQISQLVFEELEKPAEERNERRIVAFMRLALKSRDQEQKDKTILLEARRVEMLEEKMARAKEELTEITSKGGLTPETLALIEEAAKLL